MNNRIDDMSQTVWTEADVTYSSVMIIAKHLREITVADA
jgi:hypothetical protein